MAGGVGGGVSMGKSRVNMDNYFFYGWKEEGTGLSRPKLPTDQSF